jgi:hypothetical protein
MPQIKFPGGQIVNVEFDDTQHTYVVQHMLADGKFSDFRPTHGITTPLDVVPKPFLKKWAAKVCTKATLEYIMLNPAVVDRLEQFFIDLEAFETDARTEEGKPVCSYYRLNKNYPWYKELKKAPDAKADTGKDLGTWLHSSIEDFYNSGRKKLPIITPDCQGMWDSFKMFDNFWKPVADKDGLEFFVYSLQFGFSGQGDFRGRIGNKYVIADWKSTNRSEWNKDGISVDYFFQLGGLAQAEFERTGVWPDDLAAVNLDKKGEEPRVIFASEFGMSPLDCARSYISCFNTHHTIKHADYKFTKR